MEFLDCEPRNYMTVLVFSKDLNYVEECAGGPDLTIAALPKSGKIVYLQVRL